MSYVKGQKGEPGARNNDGIKYTLKSKVEVDATMTTINRLSRTKG